jgi:GH25 family lysozyme M1 (1,4-beta-N-acetylmuramidase)
MADDPNIPTLFGWDASNYDWQRGPMDLAAAARDGIVFFTHKATEGTSTRHDRYGEALRRARDAGIPVLGAYHVVRSNPSIASQVTYMLSYLDSQTPWWRQHPHFFIQVDLELWEYDKVPAAVGEAFADAVQQASGKVAVIYASRGQYGNELSGTSHDLWNANYGANIEDHYQAVYAARGGDSGPGWVTYSGRMPVFWQYGSRTRIGTQPICDANAFRGTLAQLKALVSGASMQSGGDLTMFMAQVTGNPAIFVSTGIKYRGIPDYQTFLRYRDQLGLRLVVVASEADLVKLCGEPELPGPDPVTLNAEQMAAVVAAAAKGAETGVVNSLDEIADAVVAEIAS